MELWSTDGENFNYYNLVELIADNKLIVGQTIYAAEFEKTKAGDLFCIDEFFENLANRGYDEYGEYAWDFCGDVTPEKKAHLEKIITDWLNANFEVNNWSVKKQREYILTQADIDSASEVF